jgi:hypothetical protein
MLRGGSLCGERGRRDCWDRAGAANLCRASRDGRQVVANLSCPRLRDGVPGLASSAVRLRADRSVYTTISCLLVDHSSSAVEQAHTAGQDMICALRTPCAHCLASVVAARLAPAA